VASLPSCVAHTSGEGYTPRWECGSMMPGVTQRFCASTTAAPAGGAMPLPTWAILWFCTSTSPSSMRLPVPVSTVACWISTASAAGGV